MDRHWTFGCLGVFVGLLAGCSSATDPGDAPPIPTAEVLKSPVSEDQAPDSYQVKFETTKGDVLIEVTRSWSPHGADRFYNLVKSGFYDGCAFFRVVEGFMVQFGLNPDPDVQAKWTTATIPDDRQVVESNQRGYVTFAKSSLPDSRSTQIFINYGDNSSLDNQGFTPFGRVLEGMEVVDSIYSGYGESPNQMAIREQGQAYLDANFPKLDRIKTATIVSGDGVDEAGENTGDAPDTSDSAPAAGNEP